MDAVAGGVLFLETKPWSSCVYVSHVVVRLYVALLFSKPEFDFPPQKNQRKWKFFFQFFSNILILCCSTSPAAPLLQHATQACKSLKASYDSSLRPHSLRPHRLVVGLSVQIACHALQWTHTRLGLCANVTSRRTCTATAG